MTLDEYLEHLTDNNWHTLRTLIELERQTLEIDEHGEAEQAYEIAKDYLVETSYNRWQKTKQH